MKEKSMEIFTGIITIFIGLGIIGYTLHTIFYNIRSISTDEVIYVPLALFAGVCVIYYVFLTKFGNVAPSELKKIVYENTILEKKLIQKELKEKLDK